jgi:hypothetical protein
VNIVCDDYGDQFANSHDEDRVDEQNLKNCRNNDNLLKNVGVTIIFFM